MVAACDKRFDFDTTDNRDSSTRAVPTFGMKDAQPKASA
jgi:hypothetical protein